MELILSDFAAQSFGMVVLSSVTASVIGRAALGNAPFLDLPAFSVHHVQEYLLFALLGVLAGFVGVGFTRALYAIEDLCDWAWRGPEWLRPAVGGLLLGGLLLVLPQMYGVGYPVLGRSVAGDYGIAFLVILLVGKMVATSLTIGIGGRRVRAQPVRRGHAGSRLWCNVAAPWRSPESPGRWGYAAFAGACPRRRPGRRRHVRADRRVLDVLPLMLAIVLYWRERGRLKEDVLHAQACQLLRGYHSAAAPRRPRRPHRGEPHGCLRRLAAFSLAVRPALGAMRRRSVVPAAADDRYLGRAARRGRGARAGRGVGAVVGDAIESGADGAAEMAASLAVERLRSADGHACRWSTRPAGCAAGSTGALFLRAAHLTSAAAEATALRLAHARLARPLSLQVGGCLPTRAPGQAA